MKVAKPASAARVGAAPDPDPRDVAHALEIDLPPRLRLDGRVRDRSAALGFGAALVSICVAVWLDRAPRDLRYLYLLPVLPPFSLLMSLVTVVSLIAELRGAPAEWNKLRRTGVVSRPA